MFSQNIKPIIELKKSKLKDQSINNPFSFSGVGVTKEISLFAPNMDK